MPLLKNQNLIKKSKKKRKVEKVVEVVEVEDMSPEDLAWVKQEMEKEQPQQSLETPVKEVKVEELLVQKSAEKQVSKWRPRSAVKQHLESEQTSNLEV